MTLEDPLSRPSLDVVFARIKENFSDLLTLVRGGSYRGFEDSVMFPECLICKMPLNFIKDNVMVITSCNNKHIPSHELCIKRWIAYEPGERIVKSKSMCPVCKAGWIQPLKEFGVVPVDLSEISEADLESKVHLKCRNCSKLFISDFSSGGCQQSIRIYEKDCPDCAPRQMVQCPGCLNLLERKSGCNQMTCCRRGTPGCLPSVCKADNHGSDSLFKFCGHKWLATFDMTQSKLKIATKYVESSLPQKIDDDKSQKMMGTTKMDRRVLAVMKRSRGKKTF